MNTPADWLKNGIATDCLWYEEFQGNEACKKHGCSLGVDEEDPCFLCKDYLYFERGRIHEKEFLEDLFGASDYPHDPSGQYFLDGM